MDLSAMPGGKPPEQEQKSAIEYTAQAASPLVSGEVKLAIGEKALSVTALFDAAEISYAEMNALTLADYAVTVKADSGDYTFSKLGIWCQPFYDALCEAYNKAVLRALFVDGKPLVTAKGEYRYTEGGATVSGYAPVFVYENSVVSLPPDLSARRVPLCFVSGVDKGDYELTLRLDTDASYTYAKLGYDTAPIEAAVEKQIRALREKSLAAVKELDPTLTAAQASGIAKLMPEGAAAQFGQLSAIAPSFAAALENKIAETRAAEYYKAFKELCDPAQIYVGVIKNEVAAENAAGGPPGAVGGEAEVPPPTPYLFWLIAPSPDGQFAAVEFSEADTATFVYKTVGDFEAFARQLNRALEAIAWGREVIRLTDEELRKPENAGYHMAAKRTAALQFVRANFAGRVIHSSPEAWKKKLTELWSGTPSAQASPVPAQTGAKFCGQCGAELTPGAKLCGKCGMRI